jgi:hypothetical protein
VDAHERNSLLPRKTAGRLGDSTRAARVVLRPIPATSRQGSEATGNTPVWKPSDEGIKRIRIKRSRAWERVHEGGSARGTPYAVELEPLPAARFGSYRLSLA